jgi:hypothetical protein
MDYPYYIIITQIDTVPYYLKHNPAAAKFTTKLVKKIQEFPTHNPDEALHVALREALTREPMVYIVKEHGKPREIMRDWRVVLRKEIDSN